MTLQLQNNTFFTCEQIPLCEKNGANIFRIVVKAAYSFNQYGQYRIAKDQPEIIYADEYYGEPGQSCVQYESDVSLPRPYTDLIINGFAYAPEDKPTKRMDVAVYYQSKVLKQLAVFGDRFWEPSIGWDKTSPEPFVKMPIVYDRAFGGSDENGSEPMNRSGLGYNTRYGADFVNHQLPNIEDPFNLISNRKDRPRPMGLGVVSKNWEPRLSYAGTYDDNWQKNIFPLLPDDFDYKFNQCAAKDQWLKRPRGGELIDIFGMTPSGLLRVQLPPCEMKLSLEYRDKKENKDMDLDCILIEPDEEKLVMTWSATADIHGDPFRLKEMIVGQPKEKARSKPCENC